GGLSRLPSGAARAAGTAAAAAPAGAAAATAAAAAAATSWIVAAPLAAATAVHHTLGVGQLVAKTAFQAAAQSRQLGGIQAEILLLRHLDRNWLEGSEPRRTAQRTPARAVTADHLGFVSHANLPHLNPRAELRGELANQFSEINPGVGGEIE